MTGEGKRTPAICVTALKYCRESWIATRLLIPCGAIKLSCKLDKEWGNKWTLSAGLHTANAKEAMCQKKSAVCRYAVKLSGCFALQTDNISLFFIMFIYTCGIIPQVKSIK